MNRYPQRLHPTGLGDLREGTGTLNPGVEHRVRDGCTLGLVARHHREWLEGWDSYT